VEYAVRTLRVAHVIVLGHSECGGVKGCHDMCSGHAPELEAATSFIGRWMDILRPGYEAVAALPEGDQLRALERQAVIVSLANLMSFPFVAEAVADDRLTLHGLWNDIGNGGLDWFDPERAVFLPI
jgi:carbonic anhydrase